MRCSASPPRNSTTSATPGRLDYGEIRYYGPELDEVVLSGVESFHMEQMGWHSWWIGVTLDNGDTLHIRFNAMQEPQVEWDVLGPDPVPNKVKDGGFIYCHYWTRVGVRHACERGPGHGGRHVCECGATT